MKKNVPASKPFNGEEGKPHNEVIEISYPGHFTLGAAVWNLLQRGFIVTVAPSLKGEAPGGVHITMRHKSAPNRKLDKAAISLFTQTSPRARRTGDHT